MTEALPRLIGENRAECKKTTGQELHERQYLAWLCDREHLFRGGIRRLLQRFGSAEAVYRERFKGVRSCLSADQYQKVNWDEAVEHHIEVMQQQKVSWVGEEDAFYPDVFRNLAVPPVGIFVKGRTELLKTDCVGIVGARLCSSYGRETALRLGRSLAQAEVTVVSGMAAGIDRAAHEGALEAQGNTIAVLGCGVLRCYPHENRRLYETIGGSGCLISEYGLRQQPLAFCFPERNRLIAALCDKLVIVEARKERSGAMITVDCALEQGKEVYAVPGSMWSVLSGGVHDLINQGATLLESPKMLLPDHLTSETKTLQGSKRERRQKNRKKDAGKDQSRNPREKRIWEALGEQALGIEDLLKQTGLTLGELQDGLFQLLLEEAVLEVAKNHFVRRE